jgi:regulator of cell morphogenesis and NO signaling
MFISSLKINPETLVTEVVSQDYRTADVFSKYGVEYCCGGKWPLQTVCMMKGIDIDELQKELTMATRGLQVPAFLPFHSWGIDFLADYIINIHHYYLRKTLPDLKLKLESFVKEHGKKTPELYQLQDSFLKLYNYILPHIDEEEEVIFPYIKQVAHAFESKESYAALLIKTLRKPVDKTMGIEHEIVSGIIHQLRELASNYTPPEKACTSHRVIFSKLKELDNDLVQHIFLENDILFTRALAMEKELLGLTG